MTGPSRTADTGRVLTTGVHGPRELTIVVVGEAAAGTGDDGVPAGGATEAADEHPAWVGLGPR